MAHQLYSFNATGPAQTYPACFGYDAVVGEAAITILALGGYVDPANPWTSAKTFTIFDTGNGNTLAAVTIALADISGGQTTAAGGCIFKPVGSAVTIAAGTAISICCGGYGSDKFYNSGGSANSTVTPDLGPGLIALTGHGRLGSDATSLPASVNASSYPTVPYDGPTLTYQAAVSGGIGLGAAIKFGVIGDSIFDPTNVSNLGNSYSSGEAVRRSLARLGGCRRVNDGLTEGGSGGWNQAHSGHDTGNWAAGGSDLAAAISAWQAAGIVEVVGMLGANDFRTPANTYPSGPRPIGSIGDGTTPGNSGSYLANWASIASALNAAAIHLTILPPAYVYPGTNFNGSAWDANAVSLLQQAGYSLQSLAGAGVTIAPVSPFTYFSNNTAEYYHEFGVATNGVHPNQAGVDSYGSLGAQALAPRFGIAPPLAQAGINGWSLAQTHRAVATVLLADRSGVPAAGQAGTVTFADPAAGTPLGSITYGADGTITAVNLAPPA